MFVVRITWVLFSADFRLCTPVRLAQRRARYCRCLFVVQIRSTHPNCPRKMVSVEHGEDCHIRPVCWRLVGAALGKTSPPEPSQPSSGKHYDSSIDRGVLVTHLELYWTSTVSSTSNMSFDTSRSLAYQTSHHLIKAFWIRHTMNPL